ncbi:ABC transporter permease [Alcaligenes ammonioxydans]|jgi:ABC-2 type transport system permease protein|uniref:ABC transporter permease n=1 Tax=Alcaligenes ammonioxydans TaxID=2582914 RepID=A0ABX8SVU4_9BURK|nr:ABC transporter permease [Alcaligenes ammonioxydans]EJC62260.1 multidrug ABC transporter permease [Alcaligenes faecalis subsp. faecalis NCIB 8687]QBH18724.1 ABC transporter permease [Alcaligenes faecalis]MCH1880718.1 ABC transporter permease [Alcaligenes ammonioxydans]QXX79829.1 ABC transporter permease [Alcaligenes ammonioxydans]WGQ34788.1 ABC transporter permease [Alcaligenes faecalis]
MRKLKNVLLLGRKELWSLWRDPMMLLLIVYVFSVSIYTSATAQPETLNNAPIAIVDQDQSPLSARIASAFYPPEFIRPHMIEYGEMDSGMDTGQFTFVLNIPPNFQRDVLAGRSPEVQLNIDATRMSQAFTGNNYIQQVVMGEVNEFVRRYRSVDTLPVDLALRVRFNPTLEKAWFGSIAEVINSVAMLSIILTGAALIREREHGTIEHLLVMPVTPGEIMASKVTAMGLVVLIATAASLKFVVQGLLGVPIEGSIALFLCGAVLCLFAMTSMGIYLATLSRSMPQFGLLLMLTLLPMNLLSGGRTPRESMPEIVQHLMQLAPTTHFVSLGQAILFRGAGIETVWQPFLALLVIGTVLFVLSLRRFRNTISQMA